MAWFCIRLTYLTLACEVIRNHLVHIRQVSKKIYLTARPKFGSCENSELIESYSQIARLHKRLFFIPLSCSSQKSLKTQQPTQKASALQALLQQQQRQLQMQQETQLQLLKAMQQSVRAEQQQKLQQQQDQLLLLQRQQAAKEREQVQMRLKEQQLQQQAATLLHTHQESPPPLSSALPGARKRKFSAGKIAIISTRSVPNGYPSLSVNNNRSRHHSALKVQKKMHEAQKRKCFRFQEIFCNVSMIADSSSQCLIFCWMYIHRGLLFVLYFSVTDCGALLH